MSGERLMDALKDVSKYYGMSTGTNVRDRIHICTKGCESECEAEIQVLAVGSPNTLSVNTVKSPKNLAQGNHYDVCYKRISSGSTYFNIPMGQIYILKPIQYVYPFNRGIIQKTLTTFQA
jgi:hypothetical protein